jgi:hypothetical protein
VEDGSIRWCEEFREEVEASEFLGDIEVGGTTSTLAVRVETSFDVKVAVSMVVGRL